MLDNLSMGGDVTEQLTARAIDAARRHAPPGGYDAVASPDC